MVGKLFQVATDVAGRERRTLAGEQRVDVVPGQQGAVVAAPNGVLVGAVGHQRRHARDGPRLRSRHIDAARGILEVVQIRGIVLRSACLSGNEMGELAGERYLRGLGEMQAGQFVEHVGQPLAFLLPVHVDAPEGVVQRFRAHADLRGERLLRDVLHRTAQLEVLREVVFPVHAEHGLAHLAVVGIRFVGGRDVGI